MKKTSDYDEENGDLNHWVRYTCVNVLASLISMTIIVCMQNVQNFQEFPNGIRNFRLMLIFSLLNAG
jgi:hypothetical protein